MILQPPGAFAEAPGTNCRQLPQFFSASGVAWYFRAVRIAALVAAKAWLVKATTGIAARAALPSFKNWRRCVEEFKICYSGDVFSCPISKNRVVGLYTNRADNNLTPDRATRQLEISQTEKPCPRPENQAFLMRQHQCDSAVLGRRRSCEADAHNRVTITIDLPTRHTHCHENRFRRHSSLCLCR